MAGYSVTFTVVDQATKQIDQINRRIAAMHAPIERMSKSVQRFLDVSGLRKIADGFNWIGRAAGTVLRSLTAIVPVLGTITSAATIAGMVKLVSSFAAWGNQLRTNADQIGITADELQKFQDATTRAGGNAEDMADTLKNLHKISADAFTGMNNEAAAYFRRFNISVADANGHLKSATELLPEVFHALDSLKDPADRSRVAAAMLGDAQAKLYEEYKQSGKPLEDWLRLEDKHQRATDAQLESLNQYRLAVAGLETTFNQLGRQVSATLAEDLAPLIKQLDEWVQQHQPQIIKAVDDITKSFEGWIKEVDWDRVKEDVNGILALLKIMLEVAEAIGKAIEKTMFLFGLTNRQFSKEDVLKNSPWYAQLTDEQKAMVRQQVGISEEDYTKAQQPQPGVHFTESPMQWLRNRVLRGGQGNEGYTMPTGRGPAPSQQLGSANPSPSNRFAGPGALAPSPNAPPPGVSDAGSFLANRFARPPGTTNAQPGPPVGVAEQQENLRRAMDEQGVTDPQMRAGIAAISAGEGGFKPRSEEGYGPTIDKRGAGYVRGIFGARVADLNDQQLTALAHNDEAFFNKVYGGRLGNAPDEGYKYRGRGDFQLTGKGNYERYGKMIGVDLVSNPDLVNDPAISAKIAVAYMKDRYHGGGFEGMKRAVGNPVEATEQVKNAAYAEYLRTGQFAGPAAPQVAQAPPAQAPPVAPPAAAPPINGSVNVDITHRNPPPDASVTAQGDGAVNVAPPRIEHPQLAFTTA
jgi:predicted chitinase